MRSAVVVATEVVRAARRVRRMRDGLASQGAVWPVAAPPYAERVVRLRQDDAEKTKDAQPARVVRSTEQAAPSERGARSVPGVPWVRVVPSVRDARSVPAGPRGVPSVSAVPALLRVDCHLPAPSCRAAPTQRQPSRRQLLSWQQVSSNEHGTRPSICTPGITTQLNAPALDWFPERAASLRGKWAFLCRGSSLGFVEGSPATRSPARRRSRSARRAQHIDVRKRATQPGAPALRSAA